MTDAVSAWPVPEGGWRDLETIGDPAPYVDTVTPLPQRELGAWGTPILLGPSIRDGHERLRPTLLRRSDDLAAIPLGRLSRIVGESEVSKTWTALVIGREVLLRGGCVVFLDFEDDKYAADARLVALGVPDEAIEKRVKYLNPTGAPNLPDFLAGVMPHEPEVVIVDAVTAAQAQAGVDNNKDGEVTAFLNAFAKPLSQLGPAVVLLDHLGKDAGKGARGSSAKKDAISGVSLLAIKRQQLVPGGRGVTSIHVEKDRLGATREVSANGVHFADLVLDATDPEAILVTVEPPLANAYAHAVERVASAIASLDASPERPATTADVQRATGTLRTRTVQEALQKLYASGQVGRRVEGRTYLWWVG